MIAGRTRTRAILSEGKTPLSRLLALAEAGEEIVITRSGKPFAKFQPSVVTKLPRTFLDTNVLVYCDDESEPAKQERALKVLDEHTRMRRKVEIFAMLHVAEPTVSDILAAIDLHRFHGFSYWDGLVLRMAKQAGCRVVLSEDMQHGRFVDGVQIVNPFL